MVMERPTWIVVANGSQAKIFRLNQFPKLEVLRLFEHPESRLRDTDLTSSRPGRTFDSHGVGRHAYEAKSDPKELEIEKFAKSLGEHLSRSYEKGEFVHLYLFAGPSFLGLLRSHLTRATQEVILAEIAKDMIDHPTVDIEQHLLSLRY